MGDERATRWVFDRPLYTDSLFWTGAALGIVLVGLEVSTGQFDRLPVAAKLIAGLFRFVLGSLVVGVIGGSARNFLRGYRNP